MTFVQRFGGAINLNIHFHSLVFDGVHYEDSEGRIHFRRLPPPTDAEAARVTASIVKKIKRLLERRGLGPQADFEEADSLVRDQPLLAELYSASVRGRVAVGSETGERLKGVRFEFELEGEGKKAGRCCANLSGFNLHAAVCIPGKARRQLENLCRYAGRPAVATERLSRLPDGRVLYRLRHRWRDGTSFVIFDPMDLLGKLAALVPPPRFNLVRYHGILAPSARWRSRIVPVASQDGDAMTADPFEGVWKPNLEGSQNPAGMNPRSHTMTTKSNGTDFTQINDSINADGKPLHTEWVGKVDGRDYPEKSANTMALTRINSHSVSSVVKQDGKQILTGGGEVSKDGRTLTMALRTADAKGQVTTIINIFDKQ